MRVVYLKVSWRDLVKAITAERRHNIRKWHGNSSKRGANDEQCTYRFLRPVLLRVLKNIEQIADLRFAASSFDLSEYSKNLFSALKPLVYLVCSLWNMYF